MSQVLVVPSNNIFIGTSKLFLLLAAVFSFSGCMAFGPKPDEPMFVTEKDVIGLWEPWVASKAIRDMKSEGAEQTYPGAKLIVKVNPDNTYEEILVTQDETLTFESTWTFEKQGEYPHFSVHDSRYRPVEAELNGGLYDLQTYSDDGHTFYLCYLEDLDEVQDCLKKVDTDLEY